MLYEVQQKQQTKFQALLLPVWLYILLMHRPKCRGAIFTFGRHFRVEIGFTYSLSNLAATLTAIANRGAREGSTKHNDSLESMVHYIQMKARPRCRQDAVVITDGFENSSVKYSGAASSEMIGRYLGSRFTRKASDDRSEKAHRGTIIGVGSGQQVNLDTLQTIGQYGDFRVAMLEEFAHLEKILIEHALELSQGFHAGFYAGPQGTLGYTSQYFGIRTEPVDYAIMLDLSGSMDAPANDTK